MPKQNFDKNRKVEFYFSVYLSIVKMSSSIPQYLIDFDTMDINNKYVIITSCYLPFNY